MARLVGRPLLAENVEFSVEFSVFLSVEYFINSKNHVLKWFTACIWHNTVWVTAYYKQFFYEADAVPAWPSRGLCCVIT